MVLKFQKSDIKITALEGDYEFFCGINPNEDLKEISLEEFKQNSEKYNLLDVRLTWEREQKHIGGQHIPLDELEHKLNKISQDKPLVVYCKSGGRSKKAIEILQQHNFSQQLLSLSGGIG